MPIVIIDMQVLICMGNSETSAQCGIKAGEICGGCEEFRAIRLRTAPDTLDIISLNSPSAAEFFSGNLFVADPAIDSPARNR